MSRIWRFFVRTSSFITKEIAEILRQPRLILTLILGPFLILALFGIGYRNEPRALRTMFVAAPNSPIAPQIEQYAKTVGPQLVFMGITPDEQAARLSLARGELDLVVLTPPDPFRQIRNSERAVFTLIHHEIDPIQVDYVKYFGELYVNAVNRRVLEGGVKEGQGDAAKAKSDVREARTSATAMRQALEAGNRAQARQQQQAMDRQLSATEAALGIGLTLLSGAPDVNGIGQPLADIRRDSDELGDVSAGTGSTAAEIERIRRIERNLELLDNRLGEFKDIAPEVVVQPFGSETQSIASVQPDVTSFFAPSVIVLLLQHLAVTFGALSIVRERLLGAMELFRVSPVSAFETILGKYVSYMLFGGILAAILSALVIFGLRVPMLGPWQDYALSLAALLFTSLGFGFVISLISDTDSQAVQLSMIVLLTSVFFSGFMLRLEALWQPVQVVSWSIPATYGIALLQSVMLRGQGAQQQLLLALTGIGVGLFFLSWLLMRRRLAHT